MTIRYIIRPDHILSTPRRLKEALNARRTRKISSEYHKDVWRDVFLSYAMGRRLLGSTTSSCANISTLHSFYSKNKYLQRKEIELQGICVPASASTIEEARTLEDLGHGFVIRPLHHHGGSGWNRVDSGGDFTGSGYISPIFPKRYEFRLIYCLGRHILTLRKRVDRESTGIDQPWNHTNGSTFVTVEDPNNNYITKYTDLVDKLNVFPIIMLSDLVGVDVMMAHDHTYQVCEFNTCPAISIESNLRVIASHIEENFSQHRSTYFS